MLCLNCGALFTLGDKHTCKPENLPQKGKEKIPNTTESDINDSP